MVLKQIGFYKFDSEDIIGKCQKCTGDIYNVPEYKGRFVMTKDNEDLFTLGEIKIGLCPSCMIFYIIFKDVIWILS